jgi:phosphoribosylformylglycinamidine synthase
VCAAKLPQNPDPSLNQRITPSIVGKHGLLPEEFELIKKQLGREPGITELGIFGALWSDRCSYKNTKPLLKQLASEKEGDCSRFGKVLVQAGEDNAGLVDLGDDWAVAFRIESGSPKDGSLSQASAAAIAGGVLRDVLSVGARPVLMSASCHLGILSSESGHRDLSAAASGLSLYADKVGVPVLGGNLQFEASFERAPVLNVLCLGLVRHEHIRTSHSASAGCAVYCVGAPARREGYPDAPADTPAKGSASLAALILEVCQTLSASSSPVCCLQDVGTGGLAAALSLIARRSSTGVDVDLDLVSQEPAGMNSYELLLSETQERLLVVAKQGGEAQLEQAFASCKLPAAKIGVLTDSRHLSARQQGLVVAEIPISLLTEKAPVYFRESMVPAYFAETSAWTPEAKGLPDANEKGVQTALPRLLGAASIASKNWLSRRLLGAQTPSGFRADCDAAVARLQTDGAEKILAVAHSCNARFCYLNPRRGALIAVADSLRELACAGASPLGLTNSLNFGSPYKPECFYQIKEAVRGLAEACRFFDLPVVGGSVCLGLESASGPIDPSPVVSVVGLIEKEAHITSKFAREAGEKLVLLGGLATEIGGSQYLGVVHGLKTGDAPNVDLGAEERLIKAVGTLIRSGLIVGAHNLGEGGLLVAISEMLFGPERTLGAKLDLSISGGGRNDAMLFGESQGRILLCVSDKDLGRIISESHMQGVCAAFIGEVTAETTLSLKTRSFNVSWNMAQLRKTWESGVESALMLAR